VAFLTRVLLLTALGSLALAACAEITRPTPTRHEVEAVQITALTRHPHASAGTERAMRVFIRLLTTLPRVHGRTYPFLGFNWWVTEAGHPVVDNVWFPSPAADRPLAKDITTLHDPTGLEFKPDQEKALKPGDLILGVNGMPIPTWVKDWDSACKFIRDFFQYSLPGELLVRTLVDIRYIRQEAEGLYRRGPVELIISRDQVKRKVILYPIHLPAEYGFLIVGGQYGDQVNAYAAPGRVMITRRLLDLCRNDDELALVLGHELAHHVHGHLVRREGQRGMGGFITEISAFFSSVLLGLPGLQQDLQRVVRNAVISVYSRDNEREADAYGLWYAYQAGYDVTKAPEIWERLAAVVDKNIFETTYYSDSHPPATERLARLQIIARSFQAGRAADVLAPPQTETLKVELESNPVDTARSHRREDK